MQARPCRLSPVFFFLFRLLVWSTCLCQLYVFLESYSQSLHQTTWVRFPKQIQLTWTCWSHKQSEQKQGTEGQGLWRLRGLRVTSRQMLHLQVMQIRMRCVILWSCCRKAARHVCHAITAQNCCSLHADWHQLQLLQMEKLLNKQMASVLCVDTLTVCLLSNYFVHFTTSMFIRARSCSVQAWYCFVQACYCFVQACLLWSSVHTSSNMTTQANHFQIIQGTAFLQADLKSLVISHIDCGFSQIISNYVKRLISDYHLMYWLTIHFCSACPTA